MPETKCKDTTRRFKNLIERPLVGPAPIDWFFVEIPKTFKEQSFLNLNLSRAPPSRG
jgi:hypothetical protein